MEIIESIAATMRRGGRRLKVGIVILGLIVVIFGIILSIPAASTGIVSRLSYSIMSILLIGIIITWLFVAETTVCNLKDELGIIVARLISQGGENKQEATRILAQYYRHLAIRQSDAPLWVSVKVVYVLIWMALMFLCGFAEYQSLVVQHQLWPQFLFLLILSLMASSLNMFSFYCSCVRVWLIRQISKQKIPPSIESIPLLSAAFRQLVQNSKSGLTLFSGIALAFSFIVFGGLLLSETPDKNIAAIIAVVVVNSMGLLAACVLFICTKTFINIIRAGWTEHALSLVEGVCIQKHVSNTDDLRASWPLEEAEWCEHMIVLATVGNNEHLTDSCMRLMSLITLIITLIVSAASMVLAFVSAASSGAGC